MTDLFTLMGKIVIDATVANQTIDGTMEKVTQLTGTLQVVGNEAEKGLGSRSKLGSVSVWAGNMFTKLTDGALRLGKGLSKIGFGYNAGIETATTHISTLLKGDTEAAAELVKQIEKLAILTPLGASGLTSNAKELLAYGVELKDILPTLEMLGNYAMGDQTKLDGIVRAYGQIFSQQQLFAQDANQLVNQDVPIFQLLSEHVGGKYEGMTRGDMIGDKDNPVMFEDVYAALVAGVSEGGKFHDAMYATLDDFQGQLNKLGEEGEQTAGKFFESFFEVAKSDVLPKLTESLGKFSEWVTNNQDSLQSFATTVGNAVTGAFDALISGFQWMVENGETVSAVLGVITGALIAGAVAAHPYAAAILAVVAGLAALQTGGSRTKEKLFTYSDEDLATLQRYVNAVNEAKEAEAAYFADEWSMADSKKNKAWLDTKENLKTAEAEVNAIEGLMQAYQNWLGTQGAEGAYLDIPVRPSEDSASEMQTEIEGYDLEGAASIYASANSEALIQSALNGMKLEAEVTLKPKMSKFLALLGIPGFASGIDRVPHDMLAVIHKDETVLKASEAAVYRGEKKARNNRKSARESEPINVTLNFNGRTGSPYEIAGEVKNALEMLRWEM